MPRSHGIGLGPEDGIIGRKMQSVTGRTGRSPELKRPRGTKEKKTGAGS